MKILTVKDEDGILRPQAGIWNDNEAGRRSSQDFINKPSNKDCSIVLAELTEII